MKTLRSNTTPNSTKGNNMKKLTTNSTKNLIQGDKMEALKNTNTSIIKTLLDKPINNVISKKQPLRVGTAFSGIGAPEQALKEMGVECSNEFMIEIDKFAKQTYLANHDVKHVYNDITTINPSKLSDIDLFVFGSPCQSFSLQGNRKGMEDTRGTLIYNGLKIIEKKQPKFFIYENVKGLLSHDNGKTFKTILYAFDKLGYNFEYKVLNTKDFGLPQNRERVFIVGTKKDIKSTFSFPQPQNIKTTVNDFIVKGADYSKHKFDALNAVPKTITNTKSILNVIYTLAHLNYSADKRICSTDGLSPCLTVGGTKGRFFDTKNKIFRYLTMDEMSKIQGFRNFKFPVSKSQQKKQLGNSMSVNVIQAIYKNLLVDYINVEANEELKYAA